MDPDIVIAIPSYQRPTKLKKNTLSWLLYSGIQPQQIRIFVASIQEFQVYNQVLEYELSLGIQITVGVPTLGGQLQFIQNYFLDGQKIVRLDDDCRRIDWLNPRDFPSFLTRMFEIAAEEGCSLWSIYPVSNKFFCKDRIVIGKVFCVGHCCGFINRKSIPRLPVSESEDKALTLQRYLADGKTMRYEGCCMSHSYHTKGGLSEHRKTYQYSDTKFVCDQFPGECQLIQKPKTGVWDCQWRTRIDKVRHLD